MKTREDYAKDRVECRRSTTCQLVNCHNGECDPRSYEERLAAIGAERAAEAQERGGNATDTTTFKTWFPDDGETSDDAESFSIRCFDDDDGREEAAEMATERYYENSGPSIPQDGWRVAVLGPRDAAPHIFNVTVDWAPTFSASKVESPA